MEEIINEVEDRLLRFFVLKDRKKKECRKINSILEICGIILSVVIYIYDSLIIRVDKDMNKKNV